jgi:hypothetical protein
MEVATPADGLDFSQLLSSSPRQRLPWPRRATPRDDYEEKSASAWSAALSFDEPQPLQETPIGKSLQKMKAGANWLRLLK